MGAAAPKDWICAHFPATTSEEKREGVKRKAVGLLQPVDYKESSEGFRSLSRSFEQGEYTFAIANEPSSSESLLTSETEESRSLFPRLRVRLIESPGQGESSASFRQRIRDSEKGEFSLAQQLLSLNYDSVSDRGLNSRSDCLNPA